MDLNKWLWPGTGIALSLAVIASISFIAIGFSSIENYNGRIQVQKQKIEEEELAILQAGSRVKKKPVDEFVFSSYVVTRFYQFAEQVGGVNINQTGRQKAKKSLYTVAFDGDAVKVLEYLYKLKVSDPPNIPIKFTYRKGGRGFTVGATFDTKGREWPVESKLPPTDLTLTKKLAMVTDVFRDPTTLKEEIKPIVKPPEVVRQNWQLNGLFKDPDTKAIVTRISNSVGSGQDGGDQDIPRYLTHGEDFMGWKVDLSPYDKEGKSFLNLKKGKDLIIKWENGDVFDGKNFTKPK